MAASYFYVKSTSPLLIVDKIEKIVVKRKLLLDIDIFLTIM